MKTQVSGVKPNETIEAYTGNHVARKGDRNPPNLIQPRYGARGRKSQMQMAMMLMDQKPTQRARKINGERSEGLPGSTKSVGCVERSVENLRDPEGS